MTTVETGVAGGVSFGLTPEQRELRALARDFAEKEIRPKAAEYDEHATHPAELIAKAHGLGLMNLHVPEALGGPELSAFDALLIYYLVTNDALGANSTQGLVALPIVFGAGLLIYAIASVANRRRGIDVAAAQQELPPE